MPISKEKLAKIMALLTEAADETSPDIDETQPSHVGNVAIDDLPYSLENTDFVVVAVSHPMNFVLDEEACKTFGQMVIDDETNDFTSDTKVGFIGISDSPVDKGNEILRNFLDQCNPKPAVVIMSVEECSDEDQISDCGCLGDPSHLGTDTIEDNPYYQALGEDQPEASYGYPDHLADADGAYLRVAQSQDQEIDYSLDPIGYCLMENDMPKLPIYSTEDALKAELHALGYDGDHEIESLYTASQVTGIATASGHNAEYTKAYRKIAIQAINTEKDAVKNEHLSLAAFLEDMNDQRLDFAVTVIRDMAEAL